MAVTVTYRNPEALWGKRYIRLIRRTRTYQWAIQDGRNPRYDAAQGRCSAQDVPADIREVCAAYDGVLYACEWPMDESARAARTWGLSQGKKTASGA